MVIYPNLLGYGKIFGLVVLVVLFLLSYIRNRQQCFCVKAPNAYSTPSASWLLHNGDSISLSFPHFWYLKETSHLKLTFAIFLPCKGMNVIEMMLKTHLKMQSGEKFSKGTLVIKMRTAYLEDTFENAHWRKDQQSYACD